LAPWATPIALVINCDISSRNLLPLLILIFLVA
jgi:hypothetical protein